MMPQKKKTAKNQVCLKCRASAMEVVIGLVKGKRQRFVPVDVP
jgi:hypothetical protein